MSTSLRLAVLPGLRISRGKHGAVVMTQKFLDGMSSFARLWPGRLSLLAEEASGGHVETSLDNVAVDPRSLPFDVEIVDFLKIDAAETFRKATVALGSADYRQTHLAALGRKLGVACVYVTENSLQTRLQIMRVGTRNPLLRLRRTLWQRGEEKRQRGAVKAAHGIQCNGTPTFEAYRSINENPLLFFDTRVAEDMLATHADMRARAARLDERRPLHLFFSGRLIDIKGPDHLLLVADSLRQLGVRFFMTICGDGDLRQTLQREIQARGLQDLVELTGTLDFKDELLPLVRREADLFVCCHRQGDPSCTYLETMSCGVPIVGYDNEAFRGLAQVSGVGWVTPMDRPELLARQIRDLDQRRGDLIDAADRSLVFAAAHTFDRTFEKRIGHLQSVAETALRSRRR